MESLFATPDLRHTTSADFDCVYEPAEDSFLMLDAMEKEYDALKRLTCTDINPKAADLARRTGQQNGVMVQPVVCDLSTAVEDRLKGQVDILLFNPPYVVTPSSEVGSGGIEASWAGGKKGREVTDRFLPYVHQLLSPEGIFYLVAIKENVAGTLHFTYVNSTDDDSGDYACAISSSIDHQIKLGGKQRLSITETGGQQTKPVLRFPGSDTSTFTFLLNKDARLECVFSGYLSTAGKHLPIMKWKDTSGNFIETSESAEGRYTISDDKRVLQIKNVVESDDGSYACTANNTLGNDAGRPFLNVTSPPIWVTPLTSQTVPQGEDAVFTCVTRSASGENDPDTPKWYRNGKYFTVADYSKYSFTNGNRTMTVKSPQKDSDIACYQCIVTNSVGESMTDGCLNVLLPINVTTQPDAEQTIEKGDIVNLTVVATSDPLYTLIYKWIFKNVTYEAEKAPPHVNYDPSSKVAYINTSLLTDDEMDDIKGTYRREVFHTFQTKVVEVKVTLADDPEVVPVAEAGFDYWIIGLIIGILIIIFVLLLICCVICRRKMQEGAYPVDRKEQNAGLDPEKELKESNFPDLSRADYDYYPEKKSPRLDVEDIPAMAEGDDESFGSEYGEEATAFNEDGSFIGIYSKTKKPGPPAYQPQNTESNV